MIQDPKQKKLKGLADFVEEPELATYSELQDINEKLDSVSFDVDNLPDRIAEKIVIPEIEMPEINIPEFPKSIEISNMPEIQKVLITNFPEHKESKQIDLSETNKLLKLILNKEMKKEEPLDINVTLTLE